MLPVEQALKNSVNWIEQNRKNIDLNPIKKTADFAKMPGKKTIGQKDINLTPYRSQSEILAVDPVRHYAQFLCGRHALEEVPHHHGHYIDLHVIYDLKNGCIVRVIVNRSGFYEE